MPSIKQYGLRTEARDTIDYQRATPSPLGEAISGFGKDLTSAADSIRRRDTMREKINTANLITKIADSEVDKNYSPNETVADFTNRLAEDLDKVGNEIETPDGMDYFQEQKLKTINSLRDRKAAVQNKANIIQNISKFQETARTQASLVFKDPSLLDTEIDKTSRTISLLELPPDKAIIEFERNKRALAINAIDGLIQNTPEQALFEMEAGDWSKYFPKDEIEKFKKQAQMSVKGLNREAEVQAEIAKKVQNANDTKELISLYDKEASGDLTMNDIMGSGLSSKRKVEMRERYANKSKKASIASYHRIANEIFTGEDIYTSEQIKDLVRDNILDASKGASLLKLIESNNTPGGKKVKIGMAALNRIAEESIIGDKTALTPEDRVTLIEQKSKWSQYIIEEYQKKASDGASVDNLFNPDSPEYLGKSIETFRLSTSQLKEKRLKKKLMETQEVQPNKVTIKPGESSADFLKRAKESK